MLYRLANGNGRGGTAGVRPVPTPREAFTAVLRYETLLYAVEMYMPYIRQS